MTGNSMEYRALEKTVSALYGGRECIVFGSGYHANCGILPALVTPQDVILADKLVHASIIDGLRLSGCTWERFRHNDTDHLEKVISKHRTRGCGTIWVVTESVFSMDGDRAPVAQLVNLKNKYGLRLYLDEAHAFGVFGPNGAGLAEAEGCMADFDIIVATLGKAAASQGGFAVCDGETRQMLVNRARTMIFSTALPPISLLWSAFVVSRFKSMKAERDNLSGLCKAFCSAAVTAPVRSQIIPVMAYGNREAEELAERLRREGYWVTPVCYPTVPQGQARVRLSLTAAMDVQETEQLGELCRRIG